MSDRQFYIDDETGRGHYASEPDDVSASFSDELLCCRLCGGDIEYRELDEPNAYFNCKECGTSVVFIDILSDEQARLTWNKFAT